MVMGCCFRRSSLSPTVALGREVGHELIDLTLHGVSSTEYGTPVVGRIFVRCVCSGTTFKFMMILTTRRSDFNYIIILPLLHFTKDPMSGILVHM